MTSEIRGCRAVERANGRAARFGASTEPDLDQRWPLLPLSPVRPAAGPAVAERGVYNGGEPRAGGRKNRFLGGAGKEFLAMKDRAKEFGDGGKGIDTARINRGDRLKRVEKRR